MQKEMEMEMALILQHMEKTVPHITQVCLAMAKIMVLAAEREFMFRMVP